MGVRIPSNYLKEMDLELGEDVFIEYDKRSKCLMITKHEKAIDEKFEQDVIRIIEKYTKNKEDSQ